jgi:PAT family beta-lactamase induction signal transducer AmpG
VLALSVAFLSASQDIVTDAYRSDLLEREERAAGTAVFVLGYRIAMLLTGGLALIVADHWSWRAVYAASGLAMAVGMVTSWCAPEPAQVRPPSSVSAAVIEPLVDFFRRPGAITSLAVCHPVSSRGHLGQCDGDAVSAVSAVWTK